MSFPRLPVLPFELVSCCGGLRVVNRRLTVSKSMDVNLKRRRKKGGIRMLLPLRCAEAISRYGYEVGALVGGARLEILMSRGHRIIPCESLAMTGGLSKFEDSLKAKVVCFYFPMQCRLQ